MAIARRYDKGAHSVYCLNYHLIICTKYRRKVLDAAMMPRLLDVARQSIDDGGYNIRIDEANQDRDHVHFLLSASPSDRMSDFIARLKSNTARLLRRDFPSICDLLPIGRPMWSPSYCLISVGGAPLDILRKYVEGQGRDGLYKRRVV